MANNNIEVVISAKDFASNVLKNIQKQTEKTATFITTKMTEAWKLAGIALLWIGWYGLKMASDMEKTRISFNTMIWDVDKAWKLMKELAVFANTTPFEFPEIATAWKSLLAFWFEAEKIQWNLRMLWDIASGLNIPFTELSDIYWKIRVQGRLYQEDINQLTWRWIPIIWELARQFWVNESEIRKMVETWKVWFPQIELAFQNLTKEWWKFHWMMEAQSQTLSWRISTLKDKFTELSMNLLGVSNTGEIVKGGLFDKISQGAKEVMDWLDKNKVKIQEYSTFIIDSFKFAFDLVYNIINTLLTWWTWEFNKFFTDTKTIVMQGLQYITDYWNKYWDDIMKVIKFVFDIISWVVIAFFNNIWPVVKDWLKIIWEAFSFFSNLLQLNWSWMYKNLDEIWKTWMKLITDLIKLWLDMILWIFWTSIKEITQLFYNLWVAIHQTWQWIESFTIEIFTWVYNFIYNKIQSLIDFVKSITDMVWITQKSINTLNDSATKTVSRASVPIDWKRANGWYVWAWKTYLVWEKWPELFTPNWSWNITPNNQLWWVNIYINMWWITTNNNTDVNWIADTVAQKLTRALQLQKLGVS